MTLKTKLLIIIPVYIILLSLFILKDILAMRIVIAVVLIAKTLVFIKIKTIKQEKRVKKYNSGRTVIYLK